MTEEWPSGLALLITEVLQNLMWGLHMQFMSCWLCFVKDSKMSVGRAWQIIHKWEC